MKALWTGVFILFFIGNSVLRGGHAGVYNIYVKANKAEICSLKIEPQRATVCRGESLLFTLEGVDCKGTKSARDSLRNAVWEIRGNIGAFVKINIDTAVVWMNDYGTGSVKVTDTLTGVSDSTGEIISITCENPFGTIKVIKIMPETATAYIGDTIEFTAHGYDSLGNELPYDSLGTLEWRGGGCLLIRR